MTSEEQLKSWVEGNPVHNPDRDECCPDFSCCRPGLLASEEERKRFYAGDSKTRNEMLTIFLKRMIADEFETDEKDVPVNHVHVAGPPYVKFEGK